MASDSINIASHLPRMARLQPDETAIVVQKVSRATRRIRYRSWTFARLDEESDAIARGLARIGVGRGVRTVLMVKPGFDFFALAFALFKVGAVPVLIDPGMGVRNLKACLAQAAPEAFIGIPKAHAARVVLGWGRATLRTFISVGPRLFPKGRTLSQVRRIGRARANEGSILAATRADETAAILFTSGSTGPPKGAVYTHGVFEAQIDLLKRVYGIAPGERDVSTFPLFALFGPALGMTSIVPDMDATRPGRADPRRIVAAANDWNATNMFASPALIANVGRWGVRRGAKFPTLRRAISAGAPASPEDLERFSTTLSPGVEIFTPYGATEALPVASIASGEILGETAARTAQGAGTCVGRPVPGVEIEIIRIVDEPIPQWSDDLRVAPGEIGEIAVKGPVVTREYIHRPDATALAKIEDRVRGGVYHRMGDVGYLDDAGRLWFCGRKSHRVVTASETLFTIPCERVFDSHPAVRRTALVAIVPDDDASMTRAPSSAIPVLCVELEPGRRRPRELETIRLELLEIGSRYAHTRAIHTILFHRRFPVDIRHNAKIGRETLALWAKRRVRR
ncbi:AMP-binding protein [Candidatus Sumerlaeota bacterium]|nr:AMP-binding protein [Candidatus Sumerlaeota bacterium]